MNPPAANHLKGVFSVPTEDKFIMELIVISNSKLKIMLTSEDMREYSLDCNTLDYENTETRRAFWSILDEAKQRTGFDAASEKVFVQVYPSKKGGCEMYVTKLGMFSDRKNLQEGDDDIRIDERTGGGSMKKCTQLTSGFEEERYSPKRKRTRAFRFDKLETLLSACKRLDITGFLGDSSAYRSEEGYFLLLSKEQTDCFSHESDVFVCEYAEEIDAVHLKLYIGEHGKCICGEDAVKTLGALG